MAARGVFGGALFTGQYPGQLSQAHCNRARRRIFFGVTLLDRLGSRGLLRSGVLRVRATVTVQASTTAIAPADADACLLSAARCGAVEAARRCLAAGADSRARDGAGGGRTPLHLACARGGRADADVAAAKLTPLLVAAGADVDAEDAHGETALHLAVAKGAPRAVSALLTAGANPARPVRGAAVHEDALTLAASAGRAELAQVWERRRGTRGTACGVRLSLGQALSWRKRCRL